MLPGRTELKKGDGICRKEVVCVMCMLRVENRCDEKTGICMLLGGRSKLQRNSCRTIWCSVNRARKRNGKTVALDSAELGWE